MRQLGEMVVECGLLSVPIRKRFRQPIRTLFALALASDLSAGPDIEPF
jgi:hypothetical protein